MKLVDRVLKYLKQTKHLKIEFNTHENNQSLFIFLVNSDVSFADDISIKYSSQRYEFRFFDDLIDWKTFKQRTMTINSIETELLIILIIDKELIWWKKFFENINFILNQTCLI